MSLTWPQFSSRTFRFRCKSFKSLFIGNILKLATHLFCHMYRYRTNLCRQSQTAKSTEDKQRSFSSFPVLVYWYIWMSGDISEFSKTLYCTNTHARANVSGTSATVVYTERKRWQSTKLEAERGEDSWSPSPPTCRCSFINMFMLPVCTREYDLLTIFLPLHKYSSNELILISRSQVNMQRVIPIMKKCVTLFLSATFTLYVTAVGAPSWIFLMYAFQIALLVKKNRYITSLQRNNWIHGKSCTCTTFSRLHPLRTHLHRFFWSKTHQPSRSYYDFLLFYM